MTFLKNYVDVIDLFDVMMDLGEVYRLVVGL